jgi:hypothetical protein
MISKAISLTILELHEEPSVEVEIRTSPFDQI